MTLAQVIQSLASDGLRLQTTAGIPMSCGPTFGTHVQRTKDILGSMSRIRRDVLRRRRYLVLIGYVLHSKGNSSDYSKCILRTSCSGVCVLACKYAYVNA